MFRNQKKTEKQWIKGLSRKGCVHRCTRVENPGEGVPDVFAKIPRGSRLSGKIAWVGSPYFGFYCIFINKCFEICLRGVLYLPSPLPQLNPPVCIYGCVLGRKPPSMFINKLCYHAKMRFRLWNLYCQGLNISKKAFSIGTSFSKPSRNLTT